MLHISICSREKGDFKVKFFFEVILLSCKILACYRLYGNWGGERMRPISFSSPVPAISV